MKPVFTRTSMVSTALLVAATVVLGVFAAWPIYETSRLWLVMGVGGLAGALIVWAGLRWRWGAMTLVAVIAGYILLMPFLAVPSMLGGGSTAFVQGLGDGVAATALGWKQLLTLTLPVGTYRTVLVPALVISMLSAALITALSLRSDRVARWAALPLLLPVAFGTVFGSSTVSAPLSIGPLTLPAPREVSIWLVATAIAVVWTAWVSGRKRRTALRLGRAVVGDAEGRGSMRRNALVRTALGAGIVVAALAAGMAVAPALNAEDRTVPRDHVDPDIVVRELASPLAGYRAWKRDEAFNAPLFTVETREELPQRLRMAVLDGYDGVDFTPSAGQRFTRYPSGSALEDTSDVSVTIGEGYAGVWVPLAMPFGGTPEFTGPRAARLSDSFYANRETGSAVAVPTRAGLREGDGIRAQMSTAAAEKLGARPLAEAPLIDLETMPQLKRWLALQDLPNSGDGLTEAITRLRERGYLSHSLTDGEGERAWLEALSDEYGTRFVSSTGGHSVARLEQLFGQLSDQQVLAGPDAKAQQLVAGIGDDEQFAAAAALIARAMGFESRVVMGVRLDGSGAATAKDAAKDAADGVDSADAADTGVPGVPACTVVCTGEHVSAWIEARGADGVWAPLDVSPQVTSPPSMLEEGEQLPEHPTLPEERDATESDPPVGSADSGERTEQPEEPQAASPIWGIVRDIGLGLLALALIALAVCFIPLVKRSRRRARRSAANTESRALGAWHEIQDVYVDAGRADPAPRGGGVTRRDRANELNMPGADWFVWTVDQAVYAREGITDEQASLLWQVVDDQKEAIDQGLGFWGRLRARLSLASFGVSRRGKAWPFGRAGQPGRGGRGHR